MPGPTGARSLAALTRHVPLRAAAGDLLVASDNSERWFPMDQHSELLASWQQYRREIVEHQRLSHAEEWVLVDRARAGDDLAKHEIVQSCLWYVSRTAQKYSDLPHDDLLDLIGVGNLALVEHVDRALGKTNPFAYLMKVAASEIKHYVGYRSYLIPRNDDHYPAIHVLSLDAPVNEGGTTLMNLLAEEEVSTSAK